MWTCMQLAPKISYSFHNHILKANFVSSDFARCSQEVMGDGWCHGGYVHLCYTVYTPNLQFQPSLELAEVSASLWALNKILVGFVVSALHKVTLKPNAVLPRIKQYHLPEEAIKGIKPVINFLLEKGVLVPTSYPCNTPILPIPKASRPGEWHFVQDLKAVNSTDAAKPIVPDINSILASLPSNSNFYTVLDWCSAFFWISLHPESQNLFCFHFWGSAIHIHKGTSRIPGVPFYICCWGKEGPWWPCALWC